MGFRETAAYHHTALHSFVMDSLLEAGVARVGEVGNISYIPLSSIRWDYWLEPSSQLTNDSSQQAIIGDSQSTQEIL